MMLPSPSAANRWMREHVALAGRVVTVESDSPYPFELGRGLVLVKVSKDRRHAQSRRPPMGIQAEGGLR
jgi:hypothetical protein